METREFKIKFFTGAFFLIGLGMIFWIIFTIGKDKGFTQPKFRMDILFGNVGGLIEGAPVQLSGVNIGTVSEINFLDQEDQGKRVRVRVNIFNKYRNQLEQKVRFSIKTEGILGEKLIEIAVSEDGQKVNFLKAAIGEDPINVQDLAHVFADAAESFTLTSQVFNEIDIQQLSEVVSDTAQSLSM
ncbi:MAG TPA: MlaD family protein, partial [Candidatus Omnitrophota bacterium]|nr:MlaD family protein [Candidatus Omnitrophota bacterium]